jgi:hypothetical protein
VIRLVADRFCKQACVSSAPLRELVATSERFSYDVRNDGQHFLIFTQAKNADAQPMSVVHSWDTAFKK